MGTLSHLRHFWENHNSKGRNRKLKHFLQSYEGLDSWRSCRSNFSGSSLISVWSLTAFLNAFKQVKIAHFWFFKGQRSELLNVGLEMRNASGFLYHSSDFPKECYASCFCLVASLTGSSTPAKDLLWFRAASLLGLGLDTNNNNRRWWWRGLRKEASAQLFSFSLKLWETALERDPLMETRPNKVRRTFVVSCRRLAAVSRISGGQLWRQKGGKNSNHGPCVPSTTNGLRV